MILSGDRAVLLPVVSARGTGVPGRFQNGLTHMTGSWYWLPAGSSAGAVGWEASVHLHVASPWGLGFSLHSRWLPETEADMLFKAWAQKSQNITSATS